jgi:hypothetical protein
MRLKQALLLSDSGIAQLEVLRRYLVLVLTVKFQASSRSWRLRLSMVL